jgi:hypothetical protein
LARVAFSAFWDEAENFKVFGKLLFDILNWMVCVAEIAACDVAALDYKFALLELSLFG